MEKYNEIQVGRDILFVLMFHSSFINVSLALTGVF